MEILPCLLFMYIVLHKTELTTPLALQLVIFTPAWFLAPESREREFQVDVITSYSPSVGSARRSSEATFVEGNSFRGSPAFASGPAAEMMVRSALLQITSISPSWFILQLHLVFKGVLNGSERIHPEVLLVEFLAKRDCILDSIWKRAHYVEQRSRLS
jgi:hypothetical protein